MKIIISPAKNLLKKDFWGTPTTPIFKDDAAKIAKKLKSFSIEELKRAYKCSDKIAEDVYSMYQNFNKTTHPSLYLYEGLQYKNIEIKALEKDQLEYLNENLYIADALYGLLRATDEISPYRLDFNSKFPFKTEEFYRKKLEKVIIEPYINLCSKEYSSILPPSLAINISFIQTVKGVSKSYSTHTKMERGRFIKYLAIQGDNQLSTLRSYNQNGYVLDKENSSDNTIIYRKFIS